MPRYFYTDPLAAAWMAENFGMLFIPSDENEEKVTVFGKFVFPCRAYIHPDSLHLLEPQTGDACSYPVTDPNYFFKYEPSHPIADSDMDAKIIQRNGLPFMWPEKEEVANG